MKKIHTIALIAAIIFAVVMVKFYLRFPVVDIDILGTVLSIASILFGLLVGFFISVLWSRYTEIRSLQGTRASVGISMINIAGYFFKNNKKFEDDFKTRMEKSAIADEYIYWDEGHLEMPYYIDIFKSFENIKGEDNKDAAYLQQLLSTHQNYIETTSRMNILYKERLTFSEWLVLITLSLIILFSVLLLNPIHLLYSVIIIVFPPVIFMTLMIINDLNHLSSGRRLITLEPNQVIFDALGVKRFYCDSDKEYASRHIASYRRVGDLTGEMNQVILDISAKRKLEKKRFY